MAKRQMTRDELRDVAGASLHRWVVELGKRLSPDDAGRLTLAAAIAALEATHGIHETAAMLIEAGRRLEDLAAQSRTMN